MARRSRTSREDRHSSHGSGETFLHAATLMSVAVLIFAASQIIIPMFHSSDSAIGKSAYAESVGSAGRRIGSLPFIKHTSKGWVLADPVAKESLEVCEVLERQYHCLESEKRKFGRDLKALEAELSVRPR